MIELHDTFNNVIVSRHRSIGAAIKNQRRHLAAVKRANGENSYLTYGFRYSDGSSIEYEEIIQTQMELDNL